MNRKQRRQARHRNPALEARAKFEDALRTELKRRDVVLVSASTAAVDKVPCWVLVTRRDELELTLSAKPQSVILLAKAVAERFDNPKQAEKDAQDALAGVTTVGPDAQSAAPPTATGDALGNGTPPDTAYDDLLNAGNPLIPGGA